MAALAKISRDTVGEAMRLRLAGFVRTLRDNGFAAGHAESRDALTFSLRRLRAAVRRCNRRCARCSAPTDRIGRNSTAYSAPSGLATVCAASRKPPATRRKRTRRTGRSARARQTSPQGHGRSCRTREGVDNPGAGGESRREGASRADSIASIDIRTSPIRTRWRARTNWRRGWRGGCRRASCAGCGRGRAGEGSIFAARSIAALRAAACPLDLMWQKTQAEAASACRVARCVRLDEPLHRVLRALPARRGERFRRSRRVPVPHAAGACVAVAKGQECEPRRGSPVAHGAGHRRRHQDR